MSTYLGVYWGARKEPRAESALRLGGFMAEILSLDERVGAWYQMATRKGRAKQSINVSAQELEKALKYNRRDISRDIIDELGVGFSFWNGRDLSIAGTLGAYSRFVGNSVVLTESDDEGLALPVWRLILESAVRWFSPERGRIVLTRNSGPSTDVILATYSSAEGVKVPG